LNLIYKLNSKNIIHKNYKDLCENIQTIPFEDLLYWFLSKEKKHTVNWIKGRYQYFSPKKYYLLLSHYGILSKIYGDIKNKFTNSENILCMNILNKIKIIEFWD
jgi:hypothetical protein